MGSKVKLNQKIQEMENGIEALKLVIYEMMRQAEVEEAAFELTRKGKMKIDVLDNKVIIKVDGAVK